MAIEKKRIEDLFFSLLARTVHWNENIYVGKFGFRIGVACLSRLKNRYVSRSLRFLIGELQPSNPLFDVELEEIEILILYHPKDFSNLQRVIHNVLFSCENPIRRLRIIVPDHYVNSLGEEFPKLNVESEETYLNSQLKQEIKKWPKSRQGWITQQVVKIVATLQSESKGCLLIDADTILLQKRAWLTKNGIQILCISSDLWRPYVEHYERSFSQPQIPLSFVTHHQLMQPSILKEMFGESGKGVLNWLSVGNHEHTSAISEYFSYGQWLSYRKPDRVVYARLDNVHITKIPRDIDSLLAKLKSGGRNSVSLHSYVVTKNRS